MATGLLHLHNLLRWLVLLVAVITIFRTMGGLNGKSTFTPGHRKSALFLMITCDIQLLLGLALYFIGPWGIKNIQNQGMGNVMHDGVSRFFAVEHTIGMLVGIILIHIGYSAAKKNIADGAKFRRVFWYTLIALIVILLSIPWPGTQAARPLFPGMSAA